MNTGSIIKAVRRAQESFGKRPYFYDKETRTLKWAGGIGGNIRKGW